MASTDETGIEAGPETLAGDLGATPTPTRAEQRPRLQRGLTIRRGMAGTPVKRIQQKLSRQGYLAAEDGEYGPETEQAVKFVQSMNGLKEDGVVGRQTMASLNNERPDEPGPLRARHVRQLGMSLARRLGGARRRIAASGEETGDPARELIETTAWEDFSREVVEAFMPGGGGGGETTLGGDVDDEDEGSPDAPSIAPGTGVGGPPSARVRVVQGALKAAGHDPGEVDGAYGPKTVAAVKSFQMAVGGLRPHGVLDGTTLESLDASSGTTLMEAMRRRADRRLEVAT